MQWYEEDAKREILIDKCKTALAELTQERIELLRVKRQVCTSRKQSQHTAVMLKAIEKVIVDVSSYIDEYSY